MFTFRKIPSLYADLVLLLAPILWGTTFFVVKDTVREVVPLVLVSYRFLIAAMVLGVYMLLSKKSILTNSGPGIALGILMWLAVVPQVFGIQYTSASNSAFITGLTVAFVPLLLFIFFQKKLSGPRLFSVIISLCGLYLLVGGISSSNRGDLITLINPVAFSGYILLVDRYVKKKMDPVTLCFQQCTVVGLLSLVGAIFLGQNLAVTSSGAIQSLIYLAFVPTIGAFMIQLVFQRFTSPVKVGLIFVLEPVSGAIFARIFGNETLHVHQLVGGILIVAAMVLAELPAMGDKGKK